MSENVKTVQNDLHQAVTDTVVVATEEKKVVENRGHAFLHRFVDWVEEEFKAVGKDISAEIASIRAKI